CYFFTSQIDDRSPTSGKIGPGAEAELQGVLLRGSSIRCPHSLRAEHSGRNIRDRCGACVWSIIVCRYDGNHRQTGERCGTPSAGKRHVLARGRLTAGSGRHAVGRFFYVERAKLLGALGTSARNGRDGG